MLVPTILVLALSILCIREAPYPYIWVFLLGSVYFGRLVVWLKKRGPRIVALNVCFFFLLLLFLEVALTVYEHSTDADVTFSKNYDKDFSTKVPILGITAGKGGSVRATNGDELIYDVEYTVNEHGLRITPEPTRKDAPAILFFGCSFTFGEGVKNEQSFPYLVAEALDEERRVLNLSYLGFSANHMLARLENDLVEPALGDSEPELVVYTFIEDHVGRVAGHTRWTRWSPRYILNKEGEPELHGMFMDKLPFLPHLAFVIRTAPEFSALGRRLFSYRRKPVDEKLWLQIVLKSQKLVKEKWPNAKFAVLYWGTKPGEHPELTKSLKDAGVQTIRLLDACPELEGKTLLDGHPSPEGHSLVAKTILEKLLPEHE